MDLQSRLLDALGVVGLVELARLMSLMPGLRLQKAQPLNLAIFVHQLQLCAECGQKQADVTSAGIFRYMRIPDVQQCSHWGSSSLSGSLGTCVKTCSTLFHLARKALGKSG